MREKDSFTERVLKVLILQAAHQTVLLKGEILFFKKMREVKFSADVIFIKGLSGSCEALLTISIVPETVSRET